jgi:glycosyltransferase involved in cell wall biosynthesis
VVRPVLVDGRPLQGDSAARGIGTYLRGLLAGMAEIGFTPQLSLLLLGGGRGLPEASGLGLPIAARIPRLEHRAQVLADPVLVAAALRRARPRLYHAVEYGLPWRSRVPVVVTAHDLTPFVVPGYAWKSRLLRQPQMRLLHRAGAVIAPSRATADDCTRVAGVAPERIHVVPHGLGPAFRPAPAERVAEVRRRYGLGGDYLLGVGTFEPHKGLAHLVGAARRVRRDREIDLVVAGSQGAFAPAVRARLAPLGRHAHDLGFVPTADLVALYSGAAAFVFPSAREGFGLPLLEAMGCGCVAVAFATSSLPEVAGDAAILVPEGDTAALASAVARVLGDAREAGRRRQAGLEQAARFTWAEAARRTVAVYQELLGEPIEGS